MKTKIALGLTAIMLCRVTYPTYAKSPTQEPVPEQQENLQNEPPVKKPTHEELVANAPKYLPAKVRLLAQIIDAEAKGEEFTGQVAVGEVVLNRVDSDEFPDNVYDVIFQDGQFEPVRNGSISNTPSKSAYKAAYEALDGSNYTNGSLFFYNAQTAQNRWLDQFPTITIIGNHTFK